MVCFLICLRLQWVYRTADEGPTAALFGRLWMERESQEDGVEELEPHEVARLVLALSDLSMNLGTCETLE